MLRGGYPNIQHVGANATISIAAVEWRTMPHPNHSVLLNQLHPLASSQISLLWPASRSEDVGNSPT
jgi:hypothetical protein